MSQSCGICLDPYTICGSHQCASLACGHIFGEACIEKWIRMKKMHCPNCHTRATKKDIRKIFLPVEETKIVDNAKVLELQRQLESEHKARVALEIENAELKLLIKHLKQEETCIGIKRRKIDADSSRYDGDISNDNPVNCPPESCVVNEEQKEES